MYPILISKEIHINRHIFDIYYTLISSILRLLFYSGKLFRCQSQGGRRSSCIA